MKRHFIIIFLLLLVLFSCNKKEYPKSMEENEPVFYTRATIENEDIHFSAGLESYQMFSSYTQDNNNLYSFIANLKQNTCNALVCPKSMNIQINDNKVSITNGSVKIDTSLRIGKRSYLKTSEAEFCTVKFIGAYNKTVSSHRWDFGDGETSTEAQPTHTYKKAGKYLVCYEAFGTNGCTASSCNVIRVNNNNPLNVFVSKNNISPNSVAFQQTISGGKAPFRFFWSFGDGMFSTSSNPTHNYKIKGSYPVELKTIDANNDTSITYFNYATQSDESSCTSNFSASIKEKTPADFAFSKVMVTWTDANGLRYTTDNELPLGDDYFEILSVENFENNEHNQPTKKLKVKFTCKVVNGSRALLINNAEAVVCVSYK